MLEFASISRLPFSSTIPAEASWAVSAAKIFVPAATAGTVKGR